MCARGRGCMYGFRMLYVGWKSIYTMNLAYFYTTNPFLRLFISLSCLPYVCLSLSLPPLLSSSFSFVMMSYVCCYVDWKRPTDIACSISPCLQGFVSTVDGCVCLFETVPLLTFKNAFWIVLFYRCVCVCVLRVGISQYTFYLAKACTSLSPLPPYDFFFN